MSTREPIEPNPSDRRRFRRAAVLWEATVHERNQVAGCVVLNVSEGGVMARVADPFTCPTSLKLEIARIGEVAAKVAWRGVDAVGLSFKDVPAEVADRLAEAAALAAAA